MEIPAETQPDDSDQFPRARLGVLQKRVIDLTYRNPLLNTVLNPRSASILRVVDEMPQVLAFKLSQGKAMAFIPLPPLGDDDPKDERTARFASYLNAFKAEDEDYLAFVAGQRDGAQASQAELQDNERRLKDKVRAAVGLPPRQSRGAVTLEQHARDHGLDPGYELPESREDMAPRHADDKIQTLLLPPELDRRLATLMTRCRTWEEETGINVFHAAFGFLSWSDPRDGGRLAFSPILLLPVRLERLRGPGGARFQVRAVGDDLALNFALAEKLRMEFSLELPDFDPAGKVEDYFRDVGLALGGREGWGVSRQVVFGVFPSANMAIYRDLSPDKPWYSQNPVISDLLCGSKPPGASPGMAGQSAGMPADQAEPATGADDPRVESLVQPLVLPADSSQVLTVYEALSGKNMALEGPPGTGKSQTIVNVIASALKKGLKVLFVAEKLAALEVVRSRLEAIGLGEFLLPLQAGRSERAQVVAGLRARVEMARPSPPDDDAPLRGQFDQARARLDDYLGLISLPYGRTGLSIREVIGRFVHTDGLLAGAPRGLSDPSFPGLGDIDRLRMEELRKAAADLEAAIAGAEAAAPLWRGLSTTDLDVLTARTVGEKAAGLAADLAMALSGAHGRRLELASLSLAGLGEGDLEVAQECAGRLVPLLAGLDLGVLASLSSPQGAAAIEGFLARTALHGSLMDRLGRVVADPGAPETGARLSQAIGLAQEGELASLDLEDGHSGLVELHGRLSLMGRDLAAMAPLAQAWPAAVTIPFAALAGARRLAAGFGQSVLGLRGQAPPDRESLSGLEALARQGQALREEEDGLARRFPLRTAPGRIPSPEELGDMARALERAGLFRLLSRPFREAKAAFLGLSQEGGFEARAAAEGFRELSGFLAARRAFLEDPGARSFFGPRFQGLDTDFGLFLDFVRFCQEVELNFPGQDDAGARDLLHRAGGDLLASIPEVKTAGCRDLAELAQAARELEAVYARRSQAFERLAGLLVPKGGQPLVPQGRDGLLAAGQALGEALAMVPELGPPGPGAFPGLGHARRLAGLLEWTARLRADLLADGRPRELLGGKYAGLDTSRQSLDQESRCLSILGQAAPAVGQALLKALEVPGFDRAPGLLADLRAKLGAAGDLAAELRRLTGLDLGPRLSGLGEEEAATLARDLAADRRGLQAHLAMAMARARAVSLGLGDFVAKIEAEERPPANLPALLEAAICRAMMLEVRDRHGARLLEFPGRLLDQSRETLAKMDRELSAWARQDLRHGLFANARPPDGNASGPKAGYSEMALVRNEILKKKMFIPIRRLVARAPEALKELKPCWMMSPTAVSQYLADPDVRFDLCILDEASQMPPENALPSLARCRQALIVGDSRQLPPTSFFQKNPSGQDDEDGGAETVEESILELAQRAFRSTRSLLWHYRSRHSALIGYCNRVMYGDRLTVYPSPAETRADMGVGLVNVGGLYRQSINPAEAQAMVKAALDSMIADPDRSLGLVTFNQKQRDVIIEQMDRAIEADPRAIAYVERWRLENDGLETFFVKNLENVQGDERDIILIGTVFGPETPGGPVAQRFGPVSGEAGRRRLNVLFSRAKQKIVTFTSLAPSDITADREGLRGPSMLRGWLEYCAQGGQGAALSAQDDGQGPSLEAFVQERIQGLDYQADRLVGTEGYKLDLAVKSPPCHLGYLMGLEGDGPSYGRGVSARDRDRLRPEVLAGLGWKLRRIWSSGWLTDQEGETERLREALEGALAEAKGAPQRLPSCPAATRAGPAAAGLPGDAGPGAAQRDEVGSRARQAAIGDKVRIAFLDGDRETREVLITRSEDDPGLGLVSASSALGQALIDQEEEDEVQILVGSTVRNLIVESITKPDKPPTDASPEKTAADAAQGKAAPDRATPGTTPDRAGADAPQDGQATGTYKVPPYKFVLGAKGIQAVSQATPSPGRGPGPPPAPAGSAKSIQDLVQVKPEDLERFKDPDYQEALGELALGLIDGLGPLGLETISKALAKAHDLGRRSSGIDTIVQNAIGRKRAKSTGPDKQAIYWPLGLDPGKTIAFRGTVLNGLRRSLAEIAHPELLGLAKEVIGEHGPGQEGVQAMARRLEIGRITGGLRDRLNSLLAEARRLRS